MCLTRLAWVLDTRNEWREITVFNGFSLADVNFAVTLSSELIQFWKDGDTWVVIQKELSFKILIREGFRPKEVVRLTGKSEMVLFSCFWRNSLKLDVRKSDRSPKVERQWLLANHYTQTRHTSPEVRQFRPIRIFRVVNGDQQCWKHVYGGYTYGIQTNYISNRRWSTVRTFPKSLRTVDKCKRCFIATTAVEWLIQHCIAKSRTTSHAARNWSPLKAWQQHFWPSQRAELSWSWRRLVLLSTCGRIPESKRQVKTYDFYQIKSSNKTPKNISE